MHNPNIENASYMQKESLKPTMRIISNLRHIFILFNTVTTPCIPKTGGANYARHELVPTTDHSICREWLRQRVCRLQIASCQRSVDAQHHNRRADVPTGSRSGSEHRQRHCNDIQAGDDAHAGLFPHPTALMGVLRRPSAPSRSGAHTPALLPSCTPARLVMLNGDTQY